MSKPTNPLQRMRRQRDLATFYSIAVTLALLLTIAATSIAPGQEKARQRVAEQLSIQQIAKGQ